MRGTLSLAKGKETGMKVAENGVPRRIFVSNEEEMTR
jgi:hypothetical protein